MKYYSDRGLGDAHIDLTPLIDVIFMLMIFFILTMSFSQPVLDIVLPKSTASQVPQEQNFLSVSISADGRVFHGTEEITPSQIGALLDAEPDKELNICADGATPFQVFIDLVDVAKEKRGGRFSITTRKD